MHGCADNCIGDVGAKHMTEMLAQNTTLITLKLDSGACGTCGDGDGVIKGSVQHSSGRALLARCVCAACVCHVQARDSGEDVRRS